MRGAVLSILLLCLGATSGVAASIEYEVTSLGGDDYRYTYTLIDFVLSMNQEIDIRFDPARFGALSNPVAPPEFDVLVLQPDNPPGAFGDFSLLALIDNPPLDGIFSIDVEFLGTGLPGSQPFVINQYAADGTLIGELSDGTTAGDIPEPATTLLVVGALVAMCFGVRRRRVCQQIRSI